MIPDRQPLSDPFHGFALQAADKTLLSTQKLAGTTLLASGDLVIRYGIQYLGKPHFAIVPGLLVLDYGEMLTGEEAWDFLLHRSHLYPRAEVFGYRNDGADEMVTVKTLDLVAPIRVLAYNDAAATRSIAALDALLSPETDMIASRLLGYLPHYNSIDEYHQALANE